MDVVSSLAVALSLNHSIISVSFVVASMAKYEVSCSSVFIMSVASNNLCVLFITIHWQSQRMSEYQQSQLVCNVPLQHQTWPYPFHIVAKSYCII